MARGAAVRAPPWVSSEQQHQGGWVSAEPSPDCVEKYTGIKGFITQMYRQTGVNIDAAGQVVAPLAESWLLFRRCCHYKLWRLKWTE